MAALAARTKRVDLGTMVLQPPLYNPMHLAEDVAMVDNLSRGRVRLGVGMGYHPDYFNLFGEPHKQRFSRFEESLEILRGAWSSTGKYSFHGKRYHFDNVMLSPKPYQSRQARRSGSAQPIRKRSNVPGVWATPGRFCRSGIRTKRCGHRPISIARKPRSMAGAQWLCLMRDGWVARTQEEAERTFGELWVQDMLYYYRYGLLTPNPEFQSEADFTVAKMRKFLVLGDPATCVERARYWCDALRRRLPNHPEPRPARPAPLRDNAMPPALRRGGSAASAIARAPSASRSLVPR